MPKSSIPQDKLQNQRWM